MSMQSLNYLVARSIIDPEVISLFEQGRINQVMEDLEFTLSLREKLVEIKYDSWTDFAIKAYRIISEVEKVANQPVELPSPLEGLDRSSGWSGQEQVA